MTPPRDGEWDAAVDWGPHGLISISMAFKPKHRHQPPRGQQLILMQSRNEEMKNEFLMLCCLPNLGVAQLVVS
ncbi:hypothetical protein Leryth_023033 [Lithospermum erythrorhizon]|nr:hypothetical protein Leryth_023033 [Lithospermum erythrorhizon]